MKKTVKNFSLARFKRQLVIFFEKKYHCFDYFKKVYLFAFKVYLFAEVKLGNLEI